MRTHPGPASPGKKIRVLFLSALLVLLAAGAFVIPTMAVPNSSVYVQDAGAGSSGMDFIIDPLIPIIRPPHPWPPWLDPLFPYYPIILDR